MKQIINLRVNGADYELAVDSHRMLVEVLRDDLNLTGTKIGCGIGTCGSCTVLMNGKAVLSCIIPAVAAEGAEIQTIEALASGDQLDPLQEAFIQHGAVQCGYCTPGMLLTAKALLAEKRPITEQEIREGIAGNLCRCTGYVKIVEAIKAVADQSEA